MKNKKNSLFAIFKDGYHVGNERGEHVTDAIRKYLIASLYEDFLDDKEFISRYTGKVAVKNIHFI